MKTRAAFFLFVLAFLFVLEWRQTPAALATDGSDRVLIKISDNELQPAELNVAPGTTVLWKNTAAHPVKVHFISQGVATTCKEPQGFWGDVYGIQESSKISGGGVASLCFLEPNVYRYRIEPEEGQSAFEGTIHVALGAAK